MWFSRLGLARPCIWVGPFEGQVEYFSDISFIFAFLFIPLSLKTRPYLLGERLLSQILLVLGIIQSAVRKMFYICNQIK